MRLVAHSRATAFGMISPNTSITGVSTTVATRAAAVRPRCGISANVTADDATMWATVTPIALDRNPAIAEATNPSKNRP